ncbi:ATP-binding protein [Streptomyces sp. NPDC057909]|uniref:ATP-binding protein n=1 Tax=Streptomyces sp. NPDC057909 TaxID=3346277 RepID=UPI0036EDF926
MAAEGAVCVFGDLGRGKTAAVRMALSDVPAGWKVTWVPVPVRPSVAGMRRAVFDALALPGRFPHTSVRADAAVAGALGEARVIVIDEAQRLPVPCLVSSPGFRGERVSWFSGVPQGVRPRSGRLRVRRG